jgi:uncharacterized membrane protein
LGLLVLRGTGWLGGAVLAVFFVSSNLISRLLPPRPPISLDPKSDRRDHWQVVANGGTAAIGAIIGLFDTALGIWLVTCALAAAAADTWATTLGCWSRVPPRLFWSGRVVAPGSSGGMTLAGTAGAAAGALLVAGTGAIAGALPVLLPVGTLVGFFGMVADSALGALLQGRFRCTSCNVLSEWRVHRCGRATTPESGMPWLNNDGVNFLATAFAAGAGLVSWYWLSPSA